jgi:hypothetical protein
MMMLRELDNPVAYTSDQQGKRGLLLQEALKNAHMPVPGDLVCDDPGVQNRSFGPRSFKIRSELMNVGS